MQEVMEKEEDGTELLALNVKYLRNKGNVWQVASKSCSMEFALIFQTPSIPLSLHKFI